MRRSRYKKRRYYRKGALIRPKGKIKKRKIYGKGIRIPFGAVFSKLADKRW